MANQGLVPANVATPVGKLRYLIGDISYVSTDGGVGEYNYFSDTELDNYLSIGSASPSRAAGYIYLQWSAIAADEAKSIRDYDLSIDLTKRSDQLAARAKDFFALADQEDDGAAETVLIVPTGVHYGPHF